MLVDWGWTVSPGSWNTFVGWLSQLFLQLRGHQGRGQKLSSASACSRINLAGGKHGNLVRLPL